MLDLCLADIIMLGVSGAFEIYVPVFSKKKKKKNLI